MLRFNVFGKKMLVLKGESGWQLFHDPDTGIRSRVYDVVIPSELNEHEIEIYLDDIYHEFSSDTHPKVVRLDK